MNQHSSPLASPEVEQALLGSLMADRSGTLGPQIGRLKPDHFFEPVHARIYEAMAAQLSAGKSVSVLVLQTHFAGDETLNEIGGVEYLKTLVLNAGSPGSIQSHAELLQDLAARREAVNAANELAAAAQVFTVGETFRPALASCIEGMQSLFDKGSGRKTTYTGAEAGADMVERINRIRSGEVDCNAIKTGIPALDRQLGGLHRNESIILGARPSVGKTALAGQIAYNVTANGGGVFYASLEMPVASLMPRFASAHLWTPGGSTNIPYSRIIRGDLNDMEARWVADAAAETSQFPLMIDDAPGLTPAELEARAQVAKSKFERNGHSLDLVVVDHLHKMRQPGCQSKVSEYTEISARLAEMAKRLNCPVLTLAQLNRGVEGRDDKRPQLADLRESGSIEQDADVALFIYRPAYYLDRKRCADPGQEDDRLVALAAVSNSFEVIIEKQRSGPIGTVDLWCDLASNIVCENPHSAQVLEYAA